MHIRSFFFWCGKSALVSPPVAPILLHISDYDNLYNQLALELAKPSLNPEWRVDEGRIALLRERIRALSG